MSALLFRWFHLVFCHRRTFSWITLVAAYDVNSTENVIR